MNDLMFSVCVITYNQEKYIAQTLDSILNQNCRYTYEIIVGDDCSTDGTKEIIDEYASKYPAIIRPIYNEKNLGLIKNYFNVINHCKGKYIMQCAGDDWWLPGKVANQIEFMKTHEDVGMCYGKAMVFNESKNRYENNSIGSSQNSFDDLLAGNTIPAPTVCFRNSIFRQYIYEIVPNNKNWIMEDYPAWLWFSKESNIKYLDRDLVVYRVLENSVSHSTDPEKQVAFEKNVYEIKNFYRKKYGYPLVTFDEEIRKINIVYRKLLSNYSLKDMRVLRELLSDTKYLSKKFRIIKFFTLNAVLFKVFLKLNGIRNRILNVLFRRENAI